MVREKWARARARVSESFSTFGNSLASVAVDGEAGGREERGGGAVPCQMSPPPVGGKEENAKEGCRERERRGGGRRRRIEGFRDINILMQGLASHP